MAVEWKGMIDVGRSPAVFQPGTKIANKQLLLPVDGATYKAL